MIIYENADFRGGSLVLYPGDQLRDLHRVRFNNGKVINDQISSIQVEGGAAIRLFDDEDFRGEVMRTTEDVRNLAHRTMPDSGISWNDRVTSLIIEGSRRAKPRPGPAAEPMIQLAYREVLGRPADQEGLAYYRGLVIDQGWTDQMVRSHLQRSDEYKHLVADRMIQRAYRDILGRDPDPLGLQTYRQLVIKEHWSEQRLRNALRDSPEYRAQQVSKEHPPATNRH